MTVEATNEQPPDEQGPDRQGAMEPASKVSSARPLLPSQDPFYLPPSGFQALTAGSVVRCRRVDLALFGRIRQQVNAWQLLYRTNNMRLEPEVSVTTVILPANTGLLTPNRLLAYQCAIDAVADRCFPSYALRHRSRALGAVPQFEWLLIANALEQGWTVSVADHGGPDGCFVAPREPGYRVLDGVRAALGFEPLGLESDTPIAIWGYSGGGMASSWVAEMAPTYAPEIGIAAAVLGAPVSDPGQLALQLNGTKFAGLSAIGIASLQRCYAGLNKRIGTHINAEGQQILAAAGQLDTVRAGARFADKNFNDHCDISLDALMALPEIVEVFNDVRLGQHVPACPILVLHPQHDQIIDVKDVDAHVERYQAGGAQVSYVRDRCSEHISLMLLSVPLALNWLKSRCQGEAPALSRIATVRSLAVSTKAIRGYIGLLVTAVKIVTGRPLGPAPARLSHDDR
ncbi:lipase family protein [Mycobacteroides salmoniphilum]|uniref:lipase family protein n=1 Tax=Mycobacteroides salmoniphilum TaxID=404941 RepID=UPI0010666AD3